MTPTPAVARVLRVEDGDLPSLLDNHGDGVPAGFVPVMFERFTQAHPSTSRTVDGTGLGLSIGPDAGVTREPVDALREG